VTEPGGRYLQISPAGPPGILEKIDHVKAYDGRGNLLETVNYVYEMLTMGGHTFSCLTGVNYNDGTAAVYSYQATNVPSSNTGHLISTCDDVRYAGAMKRIKYEYVVPLGAQDEVRGQVWRERNLTTNAIVTEIDYPFVGWNSEPCPADPPKYRRSELRAGGLMRTFRYDDGCPPHNEDGIRSYTDFKDAMTTISWFEPYPASFPDPPT
jgi:hypothetical protein